MLKLELLEEKNLPSGSPVDPGDPNDPGILGSDENSNPNPPTGSGSHSTAVPVELLRLSVDLDEVGSESIRIDVDLTELPVDQSTLATALNQLSTHEGSDLLGQIRSFVVQRGGTEVPFTDTEDQFLSTLVGTWIANLPLVPTGDPQTGWRLSGGQSDGAIPLFEASLKASDALRVSVIDADVQAFLAISTNTNNEVAPTPSIKQIKEWYEWLEDPKNADDPDALIIQGKLNDNIHLLEENVMRQLMNSEVRLPPPPNIVQRVPVLLKQLESNRFAVREPATKELAQIRLKYDIDSFLDQAKVTAEPDLADRIERAKDRGTIELATWKLKAIQDYKQPVAVADETWAVSLTGSEIIPSSRRTRRLISSGSPIHRRLMNNRFYAQ